MSFLKSLPQAKRDRARETLTAPVLFAQKWLQSDVWGVQAEILQSVATNSRTAVKACHASGKTFNAALAVLWWLARWKESIVVTTAPTAVQVEKLLWGEVHSALARSKYPFPKANLTELKIDSRRYAMGLTTSVTKGNEGVRFQGFHAEHILMVLDEAPGVEPKIWEAIEGARAGGDVRILALGNPTIGGGPFYDAFTAHREGWATFTISAFDTPNLAGLDLESLLALPDRELDVNARPYLTTRRWVKEKYLEWGEDHPLWQSRVLGNFPTQSEDSLLSLAWLEAARKRDGGENGDIRAGLDVAGPGEDETTLCIRDGNRVTEMRGWADADPRGQVVAALAPYRGRLQTVNVDSIGIGYYMAQHLRDQGLPVKEINVGEAAHDTAKYANLKAELYWGLRMRAKAGDLSGAMDEKTIGQLTGIRYKHNARGQAVIESKVDARKRGVKSPDRAEAMMLAFAEMPALFPEFRAAGPRPGEPLGAAHIWR